jgi:hypothetical protein
MEDIAKAPLNQVRSKSRLGFTFLINMIVDIIFQAHYLDRKAESYAKRQLFDKAIHCREKALGRKFSGALISRLID